MWDREDHNEDAEDIHVSYDWHILGLGRRHGCSQWLLGGGGERERGELL